jgi:hypothetical protein
MKAETKIKIQQGVQAYHNCCRRKGCSKSKKGKQERTDYYTKKMNKAESELINIMQNNYNTLLVGFTEKYDKYKSKI